ncbi:serine/threonine-protein kinase [Pseudomonas tohonis]|uniref:serine/threonine-protein kinase n=1 Tax=Pseudomonas tohonis TaxID=2725477 RepID=UPI0022F115E3|nr:serine/threonine-protein kinase [Pseudomonas tohonis]
MNDSLLEIPGYSVHGRLGKGGMAEVYLATQESLHRQVAIKVLQRLDDEAFAKRFVKEAHLVASLHHPSIITIHDIGQLADGRYYIAMEFVAGGDLAQHRGERFEPQRALDIVRQIAAALVVVHDKGMVHRDIKPANILFREDGTAVLSDFGIAKELELDSELTQYNVAVGSPAYSSPEQAQCQPLDARSDIYSLGVILLEMLGGTNPFRGSSYTQTVMNHVQQEPPRLHGALERYQFLLDRMLAKDPDERFADCRVLLASLAELNEGELDNTRLTPAPKAAPRDANPMRKAKAAPAAPAQPAPRRGMPIWGWALLGVLLLAMGGGLGYHLLQQKKIDDLLAQAELRLSAGSLVEPAGDSAEHYFNQVLALDAGNAAATQGLARVLQARVDALVALGDQRLAEDRLLQPEGDSAVAYYQQALALQPENPRAFAGLEQVARRFALLAEEAYGHREFALAQEYIKGGLAVAPEDPQLLQLQADHAKRVRKAQVVRSQARQQQQTANPVKRLWNRIFD